MENKRTSSVISNWISNSAIIVALAATILICPHISYAGYAGVATVNKSVTFSDIKKGQRVTLSVSYEPVSDSDDISGTTDLEQVVASVSVTVPGAGNTITVSQSNLTQTVTFYALQDAPVASATVTLTGTGPIGQDGDDGGATLIWRGVEKDAGDPPCEAGCGDPINALTGNSYQKEVDYVGAGEFPLTFVRYYNSIDTYHASGVGTAWTHTYSLHLDNALNLYRENGQIYATLPYGEDPDAPVLTVGFNGCLGHCVLNKKTNVLESYNSTTLRLTALYDLKGNSQTMAYDSSGNLISVTHSDGRTLQFTYDTLNRIASMTDPNGAVYSYAYDANNNLISVTHPDSSVRQYVYGNASYLNAMTGLVDELGHTYATWTYDAKGYAISSSVGNGLIVESASSVDASSDIHTVTNGASTTRTLVSSMVNGKLLPGVVSYVAAGSSSVSTHAATYDAGGNVLIRSNPNNFLDCFTYNNLEQETSALYNGVMTYGACANSTNSYYRTSKWHSNIFAKTAVAEPLKLTYMVYHQQPDPTNGNAVASCISPANTSFAPYLNLICKTVEYSTTDTTGAMGVSISVINNSVPANIHTFTYDPYGRVLTATDALGKVTTYAYYQDTTTGHTLGDLQSITNNIGQVLTFNQYDKNGRVLQSTDANGLVATTSYDYRGNVLTLTVGTMTTTYGYDVAGQLTTVHAADATTTTNLYDLAHRISKTTDNAGNSVNYAYDSVSNLSGVTVKDALGNTVNSSQRSYDYMNNVIKSIGGAK